MTAIGYQCPPPYNEGTLYHYTKAESLFEILKSMQFKLSAIDRLNDLNELNPLCEDDSWGINHIKTIEFIKANCKIASFCRHYYRGRHRSSNVISAIDHPRMWAQYAEDNSGACIIIDEKTFLQENHSILSKIFYKIDDIRYSRSLYSSKNKMTSNPKEFVKEKYSHLFFKKHTDWKDEKERRLLCIDQNLEYLSIKNSLLRICLGIKFIKNPTRFP